MADGYDPLNYDNLARSVVAALLDNEPGPLPPTTPFSGSGVYAIYYLGKLDFYSASAISSAKCETPIYVGKAVPLGARKGSTKTESAPSSELFRRLQDHAKSIDSAENLKLSDFKCRYLVVVPVWITLAERFLIDHFRPVWNTLIDGFGNHDPGAGRRAMKKPRWNILHPGRPWAKELRVGENANDIIALIRGAKPKSLVRATPPPSHTAESAP